MSGISQYRQALDRRKGKRDQIRSEMQQAKLTARKLRREYSAAEKALAFCQLIAQQTQEELQYQLGELPSLALRSVSDDPYGFEIDFQIRRGKTEADIYFVRDGERMFPKESSGLGPVDIAGMALRPALWSLENPRSRACIWLDEPFKHLKGAEANSRALAILKEICRPRPERNWPGLQIIMVADERAPKEELIQVADKLFEFTMRGRQTIIRTVSNG